MEDTAAEAPATDTPTTDAPTQDQPTATTPSSDVAPPAEGTSAGTEVDVTDAFGDNFDPNTLPDELKPAYKQLQGAFTKKTQTLAEQRKEAQDAIAFLKALQSEDHRPAALANLAEQLGGEHAVLQALGYDIDDPTEDVVDPDFDPDDPVQVMAHRLEQLEAQLEARSSAEMQAREQAEQEAQMAAYDAAIDEQLKQLPGYDQFAAPEGEDPSPEEQAIVAIALTALPPGEDGMPQIQAAHDVFEKAYKARFQRWSSTKDAPAVLPDGHAASQVPDADTHEQRVALMLDRMQSGEAA